MRDCWAVAVGNSYNDAERCVLAGYDNGDVKMFDLRTNTVRWEGNVRNGVCGVQFDRWAERTWGSEQVVTQLHNLIDFPVQPMGEDRQAELHVGCAEGTHLAACRCNKSTASGQTCILKEQRDRSVSQVHYDGWVDLANCGLQLV